MYVLVAGNDHSTNTMIRDILTQEGYEVDVIDHAQRIMRMIADREPDLLILDIMTPHMDGFEVARKLRTDGYKTILIFLTGHSTIDAKLRGRDIGAEIYDYICKPYEPLELVELAHAVARHVKRTTIHSGHMKLFPIAKIVVIDDVKRIPLAPTEERVLRILMSNAGQTVSRKQLLEVIWNENACNASDPLAVYICRLRKKLEPDPHNPRHICSVRNIGYKFVEK